MKEWMAQANAPKESSTFERVNDRLQLLSSKKITQYFKVLRNTLNNSNRRFEKTLQSCFCSMFKKTGQKSLDPVLLSRLVEKISMIDRRFYLKLVSKKNFLQNLYGKIKS